MTHTITPRGLHVITDNKPREIIYGYQLTKKQRQDFDYYTDPELDGATFFKYKGQIYDMGEFMRIDPHVMTDLKGWAGYTNDTFFSGILIKFTDDNDGVIVARFYS